MNNDIINNSYVVGVGGRNLVLNTLGRVWIKVKERYYEIDFSKQSSVTNNEEPIEETQWIIVINSRNDIDGLKYPGDNRLIVGLDDSLFITSDGVIHELDFSNNINQPGLTLDDLIINGFLTINYPDGTPLILNGNPNFPPMIINSIQLVRNLNAEFLNGFSSDDFARKRANETITGRWTFTNDVNIGGALINNSTNTILDFNNSSLVIDYLTVRKGIIFPDEDENLAEYKIFGTNDETWISKELFVNGWSEEDSFVFSVFDIVLFGILTQYLNNYNPVTENELSEDFWLNIFFTSYNIDNNTWTVRDLTNSSQISYVNSQLASQSLGTIDNYMSVYYSIITVPNSFNGFIFNCTLKNTLTNFDYVTVNSIVKSKDNYFLVLFVNNNNIIIKSKSLLDGDINIDKLVQVGHLTDPNKKGNIAFDAVHNFPSYIDVLNNYEYSYTNLPPHFRTKISNNNNIQSRIGNLTGLATDSAFGTMKDMGVFMNGKVLSSFEPTPECQFEMSDLKTFGKNNPSQIFLKNPNISFNDVSVFNPDGSGYLSNGRLRWTKDCLIIEDFELPIATRTKLGAIIVGDGLEITEEGVLSTKPNITPENPPFHVLRAVINAMNNMNMDDCFAMVSISIGPGPLFMRGNYAASYDSSYNNYAVSAFYNVNPLGFNHMAPLIPNPSSSSNKAYVTATPFVPTQENDVIIQLILYIPPTRVTSWKNAGFNNIGFTFSAEVFGYYIPPVTTITVPIDRFMYVNAVILRQDLLKGNINHILVNYDARLTT